MGQGDLIDDRRDRPRFRHILFEELEPGRDVVKDIPDDDRRPVGAAGIRNIFHFRTAHPDQRPGDRPFFPGHHLDMGDRRDRRQRFPPEAEGADRVQIGGIPHLAGRVAEERLRGVRPADAAAVVGHPEVFDAAVLDLDGDGGRARVDRIFDQLFDDRGRALNDLPGGDQFGYLPGKNVYLRHPGFLSIRNENEE